MKKRGWRRLGITLAILTVVLIVTAIVVPRLLDLNRYHGIIVSTIQRAVGGTVSLGRISWGFSPGIWIELDEVSISDASAFPGDLSASRVYVSVSISPLLHKKIILNQVLLERPDVRLRLAPGRQDEGPGPSSGTEGTKGRATSNDLQRPAPCPTDGTGVPCSPDAAGGSTGATGPVEVEIRQLAIEKGNVTVEDGAALPGRRMVRVFSDVDITATQEIPGRGIAFDIALRDEAPAGLGALKAQGTFRGLTTSFTLDHPQLNAHATLSSLHWDALTPYLGGSPLGQRLGGSASLTVHYDGDLSSHHRAEGSIDISRMTYTDPSLWHSALTSADAAIAYRVNLTPSELAVEKLVLKLGPLSVRASGRVQDLSERPVIRDAELSSDLPLAELARFIPWKVMGASAATLRPILEAGGRIVIDHAALPEINLAGPPTPADTVLGKTDLTARVSGMSVQPSPSIPRFRNIRGSLRLADGIALVQGLRAQVASVDLPDISAKITNVFKTPKVQAAIQGRLTLPQVPDEELAAFLRRFGVEEASGAAEVDLAVTVDTAQPENFQLKGNVGLREVKVKTGFSPARLEGLTADLAVTPAVVQVSTLSTTVLVPPAGSTPGGRFTAQLQARVDGWRGRPAITLQHLRTSPISLPVYAELVPWEKLGGSARPVKELLFPSGTVTVEALALPPINLSAPPPTLTQLIPRVNAAVSVTDLAAQPTPTLPKFESITGHLNLANGVLTATDVRGRVGPLSVGSPGISAKVNRLLDKPRVQATIKGRIRLTQTSDDQAAAFLRRFGVEETSGAAEVDLAVTADTAQPENFQLKGNVGLREVKVKTGFSPARLEGLTADLAITPAVVQVSALSTSVVVPVAAAAPGGRFTAQLVARFDGWRGPTAIKLQHFKSSPVPLPLVAALLPWETLGKSAAPIEAVLRGGGTVTVEALALPPINLSAPPPTLTQLIPRVNAAVSVTDLAAQPTPTLPKFESITGHLHLANGVLTATDVRGRVGPLSLPGLKIRVTNITEHPKVAVRAKGPVQVAATSDADVEKLLRQYGLKSLAGQAVIDMRADYDRNTPDDWEVQGTLTLAGVRAETHPEAVVVDGLRGRVTVNRAKAMDITAENITAQVNQAPVRLSGKFLGLGTPGLVVNATAYAKQLNLAHVREFFPALKQAGLAGTLDIDLNVYLPYAAAGNSRLKKSRLNGMLATHDVSFRLPAANVGVKEGDGYFTLSGNAVNIQRFRMRLNDQAVEGTGHIANPVAPDIQLAVTSPDLDLDRLIPPGGADTREVDSAQQHPSQIEAKAGKSELPAMARRITGQLQVQVKQGRYRGLTFQDLKLGAAYDHGLLTDCALDVGFSGGQISATGTADLRDPERVSFVVRPQVTSLKLEEVAPVLGIGLVPVTGPISLTGRMQGSTGTVKNLLASLEGSLDVTMGPGTITRIGRFGATMARIISFASIRGLLSGEVLSDLTREGLSYRAITTETAFDKGSMGVSAFRFRSNALTMDAQGRVDLIQEQMAIQVALRPLGSAGRLLGFLPVVGNPIEAMTSIHLVARGPLDSPDISLAPGQGIESAIRGGAQGTGSIITGITNFLQRGTGESFRK